MAAKSNTIVGLDIGTTSIKVVVGAVQPDGKIDVLGVGTSPSRGLRKGVVINIEATVESITKAIDQAETMSGCEIDSVFAALSGSHIQGFNSHGIVGIKNKEVSAQDVERVIEAAKAVAIPMEREVLHVLPQEFIIDEQDGIREPLGISGVRLEARVHMVTGAVASAQNLVKCANRCGLTVEDVYLSSLASAESALSSEEKELGVCLIDIGGGTSDIVVFHNGAVRHTSVVSLGGNHITNDIAAGLRTPISAADEIKCQHGSALVSMVRADETLEVPSTGGRPARVLSKHVLSEIIEPRVTEIFSLARKALVRAGCDEIITSGVVITGGTANLMGMAQVAEQAFNLPVRIGHPGGLGGLTDLVGGPENASAAGLLLLGARGQQSALFGRRARKVGHMFQRVANWFSDHF